MEDEVNINQQQDFIDKQSYNALHKNRMKDLCDILKRVTSSKKLNIIDFNSKFLDVNKIKTRCNSIKSIDKKSLDTICISEKKKYDIVLISGHKLNYINDDLEFKNIIKSAKSLLKSKGLLIIDIANDFYFENDIIINEGNFIRRISIEKLNDNIYIKTDLSVGTFQDNSFTEENKESLRRWSIETITDLILSEGFKNTRYKTEGKDLYTNYKIFRK